MSSPSLLRFLDLLEAGSGWFTVASGAVLGGSATLRRIALIWSSLAICAGATGLGGPWYPARSPGPRGTVDEACVALPMAESGSGGAAAAGAVVGVGRVDDVVGAVRGGIVADELAGVVVRSCRSCCLMAALAIR